jgi:hypothetical protein
MRILVTGVGRSGTTWVASTLAVASGAALLREPDTVDAGAFAMRALRGLGMNPMIGAYEEGPRDLVRLWDAAFGAPVRYVRGQQRIADVFFNRSSPVQRKDTCHPVQPVVTPSLRLAAAFAVPWRNPGTDHQVVKSIRLPFAVEWVSARWHPAVIVCRRHPLDVIASQFELGHESNLQWLPPAARAIATDRYGIVEPSAYDMLGGMSWRVALSMSALDDACRAHPEFHVVDHEVLCRDPRAEFHSLFDAIGLEWGDEVESFIEQSNRPGEGYETNRIASDQSGKWRARMTPDDARAAAAVIAQFPIAARYDLPV